MKFRLKSKDRIESDISPVITNRGYAIVELYFVLKFFGDLITADHKVFSDNCESRNNHRKSNRGAGFSHSMDPGICVQNQKLHRKHREACKSSWSRIGPKVIYTDNSLEFGKACENLSCNHCTSTPQHSETNGVNERAVRRVQEKTSAVLLQSGLNESWWADSMECYTYLRNVTDLLSDGKTPRMRNVLGNH